MPAQLSISKQTILDQLETGREQFLDVLEGLSLEDMEKPGVVGEWSIKDTLSHLSHWEAELVKTLFQARTGQKPTSALATVTDATLDAVNRTWYLESRDRPIEKVLDDFHSVRNQTILRIEEFNERDLTDPNRYPWMGKKPLSTWIVNNTYEHEAEHAVQIQAWRKANNL